MEVVIITMVLGFSLMLWIIAICIDSHSFRLDRLEGKKK